MFPEYARSVWDGVVGQQRAIAQLTSAATSAVHAYLFIGPPGCTKDEAARAFAALVMAGIDDPEHRDARLVLAGEHPDVREVERVGATISKEQVSEIIRNAALTPSEGDRKVLILHEFHLLSADGAARLLKTLEEPPPNTVFVVLADQVPPELVTVASRCVRIDFAEIPEAAVREALEAHGVARDTAEVVAKAAEGNLDRARDLANDPALVRRRAAFAAIPSRLDGTGARVVALVRELEGLIEEAAAPLVARHQREVADLEARVAALGERGSGRKALEDRHKREIRRHVTDELRSGLSLVAATYRDAFAAGHLVRHDAAVHAVERIHQAIAALGRNANETLLLQALLLELPTLER
ncbi:MAG: ATP-binding protein [Ilumatobacteraceae bacterium]